MSEFNTDDEAARFTSGADSFFDATRDARALKAAIFASISPDWRKIVKGSDFAVAELAIEVIGHGDVETVLRIYGGGGKIADEVIAAMDGAVEVARRNKGKNAKDVFLKIAERHDWNF
jgi:hypothetical protein